MARRGVMAACAVAGLAVAAAAGVARGDEFEDNDFCGAAAPIGNGTYNSLDMSETDADWYHITVPFGNQLIAEIEYDWGFGDLDLYLYDECGGDLERFSVNEGNFDTIIYDSNGFDTELYLEIRWADFFGNTSNFYDLFISGAEETGGPACPCDLDGTPGVDVFDLLAYLDLWFPQDAAADIDGSAGVDVFDLLAFLDCWFPASAGSPC